MLLPRMVGLALLATGCGELWTPTAHPTADFDLACNHAQVACESCHAAGTDPAQTPTDCLACHAPDRPASHDPATTDACATCHEGCTWEDGAGYHPDGFVAPEAHGRAMKLQDPTEGDCRTCHGADLAGGEAIGCDGCHAESGIATWRTDCLLCHGGTLDSTGAPPLDIDDEGDPDAISAPSHPAHGTPDTHAEIPCTACHDGYARALDVGHVFDATPGRAEVGLGGALGGGSYDGNGGCSNTYCHGNGRRNGAVQEGDPTGCRACHLDGSADDWDPMSGQHDRHMDKDGNCQDCHASVVSRSGTIVGPARHVDGSADVAIEPSAGISWNGTTCSGGRCHGDDHVHSGDRWADN